MRLFSDTIRRCLQGLLFRKTPLLPRRNEVVSAQLLPVELLGSGAKTWRGRPLPKRTSATARACFSSRLKKNWRCFIPKACLKRFGPCQAWRRHAESLGRRSPKIQNKGEVPYAKKRRYQH